MRIIFLNSWYSLENNEFKGFITAQLHKTDIFCLTEIDSAAYLDLKSLLPQFHGSAATNNLPKAPESTYTAVFIRKPLKGQDFGSMEIRGKNQETGTVQYFHLAVEDRLVHFGSVHGLPYPGDKKDTPARLLQSEKILKLFSKTPGPKIIGGDFNLLPSTQSVQMFEDRGYKNLVKDFGIASTRSDVSRKEFAGLPKQNFADYVFVSADVKVDNFEVPKVNISDHLPLILDFGI